MGMGRKAVTAVVCVAAAVFGLGPAGPAAAEADCGKIEQAYGVTTAGELVAEEFCVDDGRLVALPVRSMAGAGWATGGAVFSGRFGPGPEPVSVVYQVSKQGGLLWYGDGGHGGVFGKGRPVGAEFGNWRRYRSLFSPGNGIIYAIDPAERVLRFRHVGWLDGSDTWEEPTVVGQGFGPGRRLVGAGNQTLFVGVDSGRPKTLLFWTADGYETGVQPIAGVPAAGPLTWSGGRVAFGRSRSGGILRVSRGVTPSGGDGWIGSELDGSGYVEVFAGGRWTHRDGWPYEWQ